MHAAMLALEPKANLSFYRALVAVFMSLNLKTRLFVLSNLLKIPLLLTSHILLHLLLRLQH